MRVEFVWLISVYKYGQFIKLPSGQMVQLRLCLCAHVCVCVCVCVTWSVEMDGCQTAPAEQ